MSCPSLLPRWRCANCAAAAPPPPPPPPPCMPPRMPCSASPPARRSAACSLPAAGFQVPSHTPTTWCLPALQRQRGGVERRRGHQLEGAARRACCSRCGPAATRRRARAHQGPACRATPGPWPFPSLCAAAHAAMSPACPPVSTPALHRSAVRPPRLCPRSSPTSQTC